MTSKGPGPLGQPPDVHSQLSRGPSGHALDALKGAQPSPHTPTSRRGGTRRALEPTDFRRALSAGGSPPLAAAWRRKALADRGQLCQAPCGGSSHRELGEGAGWRRGALHHRADNRLCSGVQAILSTARNSWPDISCLLETTYTAHSQVLPFPPPHNPGSELAQKKLHSVTLAYAPTPQARRRLGVAGEQEDGGSHPTFSAGSEWVF